MSFILAFQKELIWTKHLDLIYNQTSGTQSALENLWTPNKNPSPQKQWPIFLSLPGWVVLLTFRSQSRRGELNGINLNLRLHIHNHDHKACGEPEFQACFCLLCFPSTPPGFMPIRQFLWRQSRSLSLIELIKKAGACLSFVGLIPSIPRLSHSSTPKPDP